MQSMYYRLYVCVWRCVAIVARGSHPVDTNKSLNQLEGKPKKKTHQPCPIQMCTKCLSMEHLSLWTSDWVKWLWHWTSSLRLPTTGSFCYCQCPKTRIFHYYQPTILYIIWKHFPIRHMRSDMLYTYLPYRSTIFCNTQYHCYTVRCTFNDGSKFLHTNTPHTGTSIYI